MLTTFDVQRLCGSDLQLCGHCGGEKVVGGKGGL